MRIPRVTDCHRAPHLVCWRDLQVQMLAYECSRRGRDNDVVTFAGPAEARTETDVAGQ